MTSEDLNIGYLGYSDVTKDILDGIRLSPELTMSFDPDVEEEYGRGVSFEDYDPWLRIETINSPGAIEAIRDYDIDVLLVMGWPELMDEETLETPNIGCVGRHLSLLPKRRGRAPVAWALIHGLDLTGVTLFWIDEGVDAGPIIEQREVPIEPDDHAQDLHDRCTDASISLLNDRVLPRFYDGDMSGTPQNSDEATYTHPRRPDMGLIDWTGSAWEVHNFIRGQSHPYPGAFTYFGMEQVTMWRCRVVHETVTKTAPGVVLDTDTESNLWQVQCGRGVVEVEYDGDTDGVALGERLGAIPY